MSRRLLTVAEAADYLGLSQKALRHRVARQAVPFTRLGLRTIRFNTLALDVWMSESVRATTSHRSTRYAPAGVGATKESCVA